jgi:hypothetical protein
MVGQDLPLNPETRAEYLHVQVRSVLDSSFWTHLVFNLIPVVFLNFPVILWRLAIVSLERPTYLNKLLKGVALWVLIEGL